MSLSNTEQEVIQNVISRLRCEPVKLQNGTTMNGEADEVREALTGPAKLYLDTWVINALEMLLPGERRNPQLARRLSSR